MVDEGVRGGSSEQDSGLDEVDDDDEVITTDDGDDEVITTVDDDDDGERVPFGSCACFNG